MAALQLTPAVTPQPWSRVRGRTSHRRAVCCCAQQAEHRPSRRVATLFAAAAPLLLAGAAQPATAAADSGDWSSPGLARPGPGADYVRTPTGVVYEVLASGAGAVAAAGDLVEFDYTLRRGNGYFIYSTADCGIGCGDGSPFYATIGKTALITGLEELLTGMRPGERRRALIPPALGYTRCGWAETRARQTESLR
jgi:FKBP-type peptidyl-prolyl cis-trans isomerase